MGSAAISRTRARASWTCAATHLPLASCRGPGHKSYQRPRHKKRPHPGPTLDTDTAEEEPPLPPTMVTGGASLAGGGGRRGSSGGEGRGPR